MVHKILVPLDGTALAESAIPVAAFLANALSAEVALLHVIERHRTVTVHEQRHLAGTEEAERYLGDVRSRFFDFRSSASVHVHTRAAKDVARSIALHVKELGCDLVILCTHGSHVFTHPLFGSIAQRILALNTVPVLIVKPHSTTDPTAFAINRILVPITTDKAHPGGIEAAKSLAGIISVPLHVLLIVERFRDIAGNDVTVTRFLPSATRHLLDLKADTGETYLARIRSRLEKSGLTVTTSIRRNRPAEGIIDESRTSNADLIVMSTHRRKGIEAFWRGSVASKVCRRSMVPVLLVPEPDFPTESTQQSAGDHS
jgi:nucleotide-binding universal stress UspA family protein